MDNYSWVSYRGSTTLFIYLLSLLFCLAARQRFQPHHNLKCINVQQAGNEEIVAGLFPPPSLLWFRYCKMLYTVDGIHTPKEQWSKTYHTYPDLGN